MTPYEVARVDQIRATLRHALAAECACGECPTTEQLQAALALPDEDLLALARPW